ncbi:hypothetical protein PC115_g4084 [Phytophthora cactorum]|uniref:RNA-directed DNA polymerase n=1 Tax=Phytophthora cactorum TaxID=29920 RepID=A0A8T1D8H1_9STRA|nr:hypothetical protein PC115_g4084 [Phytophthora cactorum]
MEYPVFTNFPPAQQDALNKLMFLLGPEGISHLASQGPEAVNARLESLSRYENALLEHAQERMSAATAAASATREESTRPKPFLCVALVISKLGHRAREWSLTCSTPVDAAFPTWAQSKQQLSRVFAPPHQAYRIRSRFLATRQGKKELLDYVQELRTLIAGTAVDPLPEAVTLTVSMEGLRTSVARTEVFRVHPSSFEEAVSVALNAEHNFRSARSGCAPASVDASHTGVPAICGRVAQRKAPPSQASGSLRGNGKKLSSVGPPGGRGQQDPAPKRAGLSYEKNVCKPGLLVVQANVKGFEKSWRVLIDSGASGNYARRSTLEGGQQYAEALEVQTRDTISVRLATGTLVTVSKVSVDLGVKFLDFDSVERYLVLDLDSRYDLILGMAWLERHEPWIDWRSKTLGATHLAPIGALVHEPTSARKQKRFWRGHEAESALVLGIRMSELVSNEVAIVHERGLQDVRGAARYPRSRAGLVSDPLLCPDKDERGVARNPLSGTDMVNDLPLRAPESRRGVTRNPLSGVSQVNDSPLRGPRGTVDRRSRHHGRSPGDAGGVAPIPLSEGHGPHGSELRVSRDTDSSLRTAGAVAPGRGDGDVTTPISSGRSRSRRKRRMRRRASVTSRTSDEVSNVTSSEAPRDCNPAKIKAIVEWPAPKNQKDLRKWLGFANYLHKYSANYAEIARPLSNLLKKDAPWCWEVGHDEAFQAVKDSLLQAPILALPDPDRPFSVVCDASDFAIGCALLQADAEGRERGIAFESRQLKAAEKNYPVHDKELLAMKYALVKFRVHLLGSKPFVIYTDHASLPTATQSPHLSQRMARWLSFFAEYNFEVKYKPGRLNVVADALSRRSDYELAHVTAVTSSVFDLIRAAYAHDDIIVKALTLDGGLLYYSTDSEDASRVVIPHDEDLKYRILYEVHDTPVGGHLSREKTYDSMSTMYWWPKLYKWVGAYVLTCETCQRTKSSPHAAAPLASLPVPTGCWQSISMDFVFGLPKDKAGNTGIVVFVDCLSKMAHLAAVPDTIGGEGTALLFLERVFRQHGLPEAIVSDR